MTVPVLWVPDRKDIIWIDFMPKVGAVEMDGKHPMLVLSPKAFNERTGLVIGLPMTHAASNEDNPFAVKYAKGSEIGYILAHQPKSFDWRVRNASPHPWKAAPAPIFATACETLNQILALA